MATRREEAEVRRQARIDREKELGAGREAKGRDMAAGLLELAGEAFRLMKGRQRGSDEPVYYAVAANALLLGMIVEQNNTIIELLEKLVKEEKADE